MAELHNSKPTKVSMEDNKGTIFSAKLESFSKPASGNLFVAHGLLIKPSFEKIRVEFGTDVRVKSFVDGVLVPLTKSQRIKLRLWIVQILKGHCFLLPRFLMLIMAKVEILSQVKMIWSIEYATVNFIVYARSMDFIVVTWLLFFKFVTYYQPDQITSQLNTITTQDVRDQVICLRELPSFLEVHCPLLH